MPQGQPCSLHPDQPIAGACDRCGDFGCRICIPNGRSCTKCVPNWQAPKPDLQQIITQVFQDPRWLSKVLGGALCTLFAFLLIPMFVHVGYMMRTAERERTSPGAGLPDWDDLGGLCWSGFKAYVCFLLPTLFLYLLFAVAVGAVIALSGGFSSQGPNPLAIFGILGLELALIGIMFAYGALVPAIQIHYIRSGSVLAGFHLGSIWRIISGHPVDYVVFVLIAFVLYFIATFVGELMCFVGLFFTMPLGLYIESIYLGRYCAWLDSLEPPPSSV
jgi:hypothetical protein